MWLYDHETLWAFGPFVPLGICTGTGEYTNLPEAYEYRFPSHASVTDKKYTKFYNFFGKKSEISVSLSNISQTGTFHLLFSIF